MYKSGLSSTAASLVLRVWLNEMRLMDSSIYLGLKLNVSIKTHKPLNTNLPPGVWMAKCKESSQIFETQGKVWRLKDVFGNAGRQGWNNSLDGFWWSPYNTGMQLWGVSFALRGSLWISELVPGPCGQEQVDTLRFLGCRKGWRTPLRKTAPRWCCCRRVLGNKLYLWLGSFWIREKFGGLQIIFFCGLSFQQATQVDLRRVWTNSDVSSLLVLQDSSMLWNIQNIWMWGIN